MPTQFKPFTVVNLPAVATTAYTAPAATTTSITSCIFSNKGLVDITIDVIIVRAPAQGGATVYVVNDAIIPNGSSLDIIVNKPIVLGAGDAIRALASAPSIVDVVGSVMEQI